MATPRQKVQVGIFLSVCALLLLGILVVLSDVQREEKVPYVIEFDETVSGLAAGSDVRYRGVPVGRVTDISVTTNNLIRVRVEIRPSAIRVRQGMTAQLGTAGITGQLYINLEGGEPEAPPLGADAIIPSIPSLFTNISTELPTILASINSILLSIHTAMGQEGQVATILRDVGNIMISFHSTVTDVNARTVALLEKVEAFLDSANHLIETEVQPLMADLRTTSQSTRRMVERSGPPLQTTLSEGTRALRQLTQFTEQLAGMSEEVTLTMRQLRGETTDATLNFRQAVRSLRETLLSAKRLIDYLEQDPTAFLTGKRVPVQMQDRQGRQ